MRVEFGPVAAIGLLFVVLVAIVGGSAVASEIVSNERSDPDVEHVVLEDDSTLWPYTSRTPSYAGRTLSINLVVYGDVDVTEHLLREAVVGEWDEVEDEQQDIAPSEEFDVDVNRTGVVWGSADGATRYVYVETPDGSGRWMAESYQLHDGDYLGSRHHVRAYADPVGGNWTAMQAHQEHWDWFHLRHTVQSIEGGQVHVESEFIDRWLVEEVHRERFGNDHSADADGWATVVWLDDDAASWLFGVLFVASVGVADYARRLEALRTDDGVRDGARAFLVIASIVGMYAAIRFGAIGIERAILGTTPKLIVAAFYPTLVVGTPICAYLTARKLDRTAAFAAAAIGFTIATFLDYSYLGVTALPIDTIVHRAALAVALGLIAAGASRTARETDVSLGLVRTGVLVWAVAVLLPLLQFV